MGRFIDDGTTDNVKGKGKIEGGMTCLKGLWGRGVELSQQPWQRTQPFVHGTHTLPGELMGDPSGSCDVEQVGYLSMWRPTGLQRERGGARDDSHKLLQSTGGFGPKHLSGL